MDYCEAFPLLFMISTAREVSEPEAVPIRHKFQGVGICMRESILNLQSQVSLQKNLIHVFYLQIKAVKFPVDKDLYMFGVKANLPRFFVAAQNDFDYDS